MGILKRNLRENPFPMRLIRESRMRRVQDKPPKPDDEKKPGND